MGGRNEPFEVPSDLPVPYVVVPYLSEMQLGYAAADLMLVPRRGDHRAPRPPRSGCRRSTCRYPHSNQEQKRNALPVVEAGGGLLVDDAELTPEWIERTVIPLIRDPQRLAAMGRGRRGVRPARRRRGAAGLRLRSGGQADDRTPQIGEQDL